ncbi:prolyl-tRNA synthetase associated domain-containing protein [Pseudoruegeria sp. SHC-113]|uniref:prolyl-tRNA synthetase associated domain-containing protein n=1 Tax=Pseudoruegeria sp. SHC-113 TaxID=2855439 RepID=UPI0021BB412D|nr:prolyl-tRNA synthetase associated domain-containing protein [Pseudoruegeria sp. SHC-113]MCT8159063.1 prolyl-tRNA synthetase associated domain-containing protein [Pseudoruegeria sp. SHC-113]
MAEDTHTAVTAEGLLAQLKAWGLPYMLHHHVPLRTVEEAKSVEASMAVPGQKAFRTKNLFLRDRKKRGYLITLEQDRAVDLKALGAQIGAPGLSFGSPERLKEALGVAPGAVSALAMINGVEAGVTFLMDAAAQEADVIYMHPLVNDQTVAMRREDVLAFMERIGCDLRWLSF